MFDNPGLLLNFKSVLISFSFTIRTNYNVISCTLLSAYSMSACNLKHVTLDTLFVDGENVIDFFLGEDYSAVASAFFKVIEF